MRFTAPQCLAHPWFSGVSSGAGMPISVTARAAATPRVIQAGAYQPAAPVASYSYGAQPMYSVRAGAALTSSRLVNSVSIPSYGAAAPQVIQAGAYQPAAPV